MLFNQRESLMGVVPNSGQKNPSLGTHKYQLNLIRSAMSTLVVKSAAELCCRQVGTLESYHRYVHRFLNNVSIYSLPFSEHTFTSSNHITNQTPITVRGAPSRLIPACFTAVARHSMEALGQVSRLQREGALPVVM